MPRKTRAPLIRELILENPNADREWVTKEMKKRHNLRIAPTQFYQARSDLKRTGQLEERRETELVHSPTDPFEQGIEFTDSVGGLKAAKYIISKLEDFAETNR